MQGALRIDGSGDVVQPESAGGDRDEQSGPRLVEAARGGCRAGISRWQQPRDVTVLWFRNEDKHFL
jgi:hypothetical protein